ncbi:MAG: lipoprotein-releasing ABC transporter permease subunit [Sphingomonadales bacterium]|nr:lipoprotein-releasing ABC transporter permease subunit [Sphingomonadales bacterium]
MAKPVSLPRIVALRYISAGKRSHLVSFISAISIGGLALGIAILITVLSVMNGFDREMRENILGIVPHITLSSDANLSLAAWEEIESISTAQPGVAAVSPAIEYAGVAATEAGSRGIIINGIDIDSAINREALERFIDSGSLADLAGERWGVTLGAGLAESLAVSVGDSVDLFSPSISLNPLTPLATFRQFRVVAIFRVGTRELDNDLAIINLSAARALFRLRTPHNTLQVATTDVLQADSVHTALLDEMPGGVQATSWTSRYGAVYENIRFSRSIVGFLLWLLIAVAAFNLVVSLIMIVRDKRGDIAILRTMGSSPNTISKIFLWQGCLIGAIGIAIGVVLGIIGSLQVTNLARFIEQSFSIQLLNAEVYPLDFLPSELSAIDVLGVVIGVMLLCILATIYPARRAAAVQPAEALRTE